MTAIGTFRRRPGKRFLDWLLTPAGTILILFAVLLVLSGVLAGNSTALKVLWLVTISAVVVVSVAIAFCSPKPVPFAETSLLGARLVWLARVLWATALMVTAGYLGAVISMQLEIRKNDPAGFSATFTDALGPVLGIVASFVLPLLALWLVIDLVRIGRWGRRKALRRAVVFVVWRVAHFDGSPFRRRHLSVIIRSRAFRAWTTHLSRWHYTVLLCPCLALVAYISSTMVVSGLGK